jgi:putative PIN family toxin of toxin-antitoxin system
VRVVFDSNIFVSALVFPGGRADEAMRRILDGIDTLLISPAIVHEVLGVLADKFSRDREELSRVAVLLADLGTLVTPRMSVSVLADEADNRILECADAGKADLIVTGDKAVLALGSHQGIAIVTLARYLA